MDGRRWYGRSAASFRGPVVRIAVLAALLTPATIPTSAGERPGRAWPPGNGPGLWLLGVSGSPFARTGNVVSGRITCSAWPPRPLSPTEPTMGWPRYLTATGQSRPERQLQPGRQLQDVDVAVPWRWRHQPWLWPWVPVTHNAPGTPGAYLSEGLSCAGPGPPPPAGARSVLPCRRRTACGMGRHVPPSARCGAAASGALNFGQRPGSLVRPGISAVRRPRDDGLTHPVAGPASCPRAGHVGTAVVGRV